MKISLTPRGAVAALALGALAVPASAQQLGSALDVGERATRQAEQTQERINQLDDQRSDAVREYRTLLQRRDAAELFARQQEKVVESQRRELESLNDQLGRVDEITEQMVPMMLGMIDDLEAFVRADLPFKLDIRNARIANLRAAMENAQVAPAEAYRLIMDAYSAELEYGASFDTYEENIVREDGQEETVTFFQYGRVALLYVNQAKTRAARYDRETNSWQPMGNQELRDLQLAIRVGEEKTQPQILFAPVEKFSVE